MKISLNSVIEKVIWGLLVFLLTSFLTLGLTIGGRYLFLAATLLIIPLSALANNGILRIRLHPYHFFLLFFATYTALSSLWGLRSSDAIGKASTLFQILACVSVLFIHYDKTVNPRPLYLAIMWSGYFVTIYAILVYGMDTLLASAQDVRVGNEFNNINSVAMTAAISCMFQWNELLNKRSIWSTVFVIPAVILITATQSRKAFVMLFAGIVLLYVVKTMGQKGFAKKLLKLLAYFVVLIVAMTLLFRLPIFSGSLERMGQLLNFWSNEGKVDHSTIERNEMMELGFRYWKENPLFGVGIGCPHILSAAHLNRDAYLHNNFIELLCGGGIVGFVLFYSMYVYLAYSIFKYRNADPETAYLLLTWLALLLVMDYGSVSYYTKTRWYYLAIIFISLDYLRRKHREMISNAEESAA